MAPSLVTSITGRIADGAVGVFGTTATVTAVERLSEHYTEVELTSPGFRSSSWSPGHKLQLRPESGTVAFRTYTPIDWDADAGATRVLAYSHGDGPGAAWFRAVAVDDRLAAFGPRRSIDLGGVGHQLVFVGDETTIGLAIAIRSELPDIDVAHVVEANELDETTGILAHYGLADETTLLAKDDDRAPLLQAVGAAIGSRSSYDLLLSGDAATVAAVRRWVKVEGHTPGTTKAKAYWAEGRTGLD